MPELYFNHTVAIELPNGLIKVVREFACTDDHAIDKAYYKYLDIQPIRGKYLVMSTVIKLSCILIAGKI